MSSNSSVFSCRSLASVTPNEVSKDAQELLCPPDAAIPTDNELEAYAHSIGLTNEGKSDAKCVVVCFFYLALLFLDVRRLAYASSPNVTSDLLSVFVQRYTNICEAAVLDGWRRTEERNQRRSESRRRSKRLASKSATSGNESFGDY